MTDEGRGTERPAPETIGGEAEFALALRALKAWSGLSFREIETRARAAGLRLPFSTASGMLGRTTLPREDLLIAFTTACGLDETEVAAWLAARKRLAVAGIVEPAPAPVAATPASVPTPVPVPVPVQVRPRFQPPRPKLRRRVGVAACALLVAAATFVAHGQFAHEVDVNTVEGGVTSATGPR